MNDLNSLSRERVSALVDGRLQGDACAQALDDVLSDPQSLQIWHAYHVVGDVMRSPELAPSASDHAFLAKLELRLAQEPERPRLSDIDNVPATPRRAGIASTDRAVPSANASVFRWKMLAGVACTALVGVVGLSLWTQTGQQSGAQLASQNRISPTVALVATTEAGGGAMLRDPRLDELMAAHRQLAGHSALQVPAGFLRNATFEGPSR